MSELPAPENEVVSVEPSTKIQNGVLFLRNPAVRNSSLANKVNFLKGKGMSIEEVHTCFAEAGQPHDIELLKAAANGTLTKASAVQGAAPPPPQVPGYTTSHNVASATLPPVAEAWTWKDYFVGATVATLGAMGVYQYSPYHVVPKDELDALRRASSLGAKKSKKKTRVSRHTGVGDMIEGNFLPSSDGATAGVPSTSVVEPPALPAEPIKDTTTRVLEEALEKATKDVADKAADAEKARREKAEIAVNNGKLKGQLIQVNRTLERSEGEVTKLKKRIEELEKAATPEATESVPNPSELSVTSPESPVGGVTTQPLGVPSEVVPSVVEGAEMVPVEPSVTSTNEAAATAQ